MSASVVAADPNLQNWFMNSSQDTDPLSYHHHHSYHTNTTISTSHPHPMPSSHSKHLFGTSIFGAQPSSYTTATNISAHSPLVPPSCAPIATTHNAHNRSPTPPPSTPPIVLDDMSSINHLITTLSYAIQEMNHYLDSNQCSTTITKAINAKTTNCRNEMVSTLSYYQTYIQSKSPHLGSRSLSPLEIDIIDASKQTLLQQDNTANDKDPYYPLEQGLDFERTTYGASTSSSHSHSHSNTANNAKAIALDVVQHIIGTPGPLITDESIPQRDPSPAPPPLATPPLAIAISQQMDEKENEHKLKSTLNAYAQPYESQHGPYTNPMVNGVALPIPIHNQMNQIHPLPLPQTTPSNMQNVQNMHSPRYIQQSLTSPSITSNISSPTQTYLMHQFQQKNASTSTQHNSHNIQQYYNTLAVQQCATTTKHTQSPQEYAHSRATTSALLRPQNRIINMHHKKGVEDAKELDAYLDDEEDDDDGDDDEDDDDETTEEHGNTYNHLQNIIDHLDIEVNEDRNMKHAQNNNKKVAHTTTTPLTSKTKAAPMNHNNKNKTKPLWSAIAKQVAKAPTVIHSHSHSTKTSHVNNNNEDEKSPELLSNDNYNKRYHWNNNNKRHSSERSSASSHSSSSSSHNHNQHNNVAMTSNTNTNSNTSNRTPSPSPSEQNNHSQHQHHHHNHVHNPHHHNNNHHNRNVNNNNFHRRNHNNNNHTKHVQNGKNERCRVFVSNLPPNVTDADIRHAFSHCGEISNTVWFPSRTDGKFYGSGLITFCDGNGSKEALKMNQQNVLGRIIRCEYSSCQDPVKVKPPGCRTIYLNNVPRDAHESRIRQVFKHCGKIKRVRFHERDTKRTGGAFVEFENTSSCDKALDLHGKIVDNHPLYVDYQRY